MLWKITDGFITGIGLSFPRTVDSETALLWLQLTNTKTYTKLPIKRKTKEQN